MTILHTLTEKCYVIDRVQYVQALNMWHIKAKKKKRTEG